MNVLNQLPNSPPLPEKDSGIKASYLLDLPAEQRRIMRLLLRHAEMSLPDLRKALEALPADEQMTADQMDKAIQTLIEQNWLIRFESKEEIRYKANFQRKTENDADKPSPRRRSASPIARGVWDALEAKDKKE
jgi:hypothetical protein